MTLKLFLVVFSCLVYGIQGAMQAGAGQGAANPKLSKAPRVFRPRAIELILHRTSGNVNVDDYWTVSTQSPHHSKCILNLEQDRKAGNLYMHDALVENSDVGYKGISATWWQSGTKYQRWAVGHKSKNTQKVLLESAPDSKINKIKKNNLLSIIDKQKPTFDIKLIRSILEGH